MPEKKTATPIVDYFVNLRRKKNTKLDSIDLMIDWRGEFTFQVQGHKLTA